MLLEAFDSKRVLVTGHTGFKGSWLCEWLLMLGADVTGYALPPPTTPALFEQLELGQRISHCLGDVRNTAALRELVQRLQPEFVFHLAAQPLVRQSYASPVETFTTNVVGTVNILDAIRTAKNPCVAIIATTDKCYENTGSGTPFRESDPLGGKDPYSASKACAELAAAAYRESFFTADPALVSVATARAGNVLGGGDWAEDRILPDCIRALAAGKRIGVRNPHSVRPWQHVLESLSGYLVLAARIADARYFQKRTELAALCSAFNFGPSAGAERPVSAVVERVLEQWPGEWEDVSGEAQPPEAPRLQLSIDQAANLLGWRPAWDFNETIDRTVKWYRAASMDGDAVRLRALTRSQISDYLQAAQKAAVPWTQ